MVDLPTFKDLTIEQVTKALEPFVPFEGATNAQIRDAYLCDLGEWLKGRRKQMRAEQRRAAQVAVVVAENEEINGMLPAVPMPTPPVEPPPAPVV